MKAVAAIALGIAGAAAISVDRSPPPGGVYRLKPAIYVANGSDCRAPANAAILRYDRLIRDLAAFRPAVGEARHVPCNERQISRPTPSHGRQPALRR